jgi:hypothetical protein
VPDIKYSGLLFLTLVLTACRVSREDDPIVHYTADPEYQIDLYEQRDPANGAPIFGLWVESTKSFEFANYIIEDTIAVGDREIEVDLIGIQKPDTGIGPASPARTFIPIGKLADGQYQLNISLAGAITNKGTLTVSSGPYIASFSQPQGIIMQNLVMDHIPDGMLWGYAATPSEPQQPVAAAFLLDLKSISADPGLAPGYYSYFTISGTGSIFLHSSILPNVQAEPFVRTLTAPYPALKGLLQTYRSKPLTIRCLSTTGEQ